MTQTRCSTTRRQFMCVLAGATLGGSWQRYATAKESHTPNGSKRTSGVKGIERSVLWNGRAGGTTWFHPRGCMIPSNDGPIAFMTLQSISGSDMFGHVHWSTSKDLAGR